MGYTGDLLKVVDRCQHRTYITNKYTGRRIAVDCGQCDYCIHKRAQKSSMRVKTAGSAFKHCWFVTLTYDNEHIPLFYCTVLKSECETVLNEDGTAVFSDEFHEYIPVSDFKDNDRLLKHIFFNQVQGTVPFDREIKEYVPVSDNWFLSMPAIRSFISKSHAGESYGKDGSTSLQYGDGNLIPFLNYVDVQNYIKRLRRHLSRYTNEKISFYAVGEYGPVHFRPHFHILLFFNSDEITEVLRQCHNKSWTFGRSDCQASRGGSASYVAGYINSLYNAPTLYKACRAFRPYSRASLGFFEKGETYVEDEDPYAQIERKLDSCINGRCYDFNGVCVKSTSPMSYISSLLPVFTSVSYDDIAARVGVLSAVHSVPKRLARLGLIDYNPDSVLSIARAYVTYLRLNPVLLNEDRILLDECRCLSSTCRPAFGVDPERFLSKLYKLFLQVTKFFRNWHLPDFGASLDPYIGRIRFILRTGLEIQSRLEYTNLIQSLSLQADNPEISHYMFSMPDNGSEEDCEQVIRDMNIDLINQLRLRSSSQCADMIKHKRLNDANDIFNRMV